MNQENIGKFIKDLRTKNKLSQSELAKQLNVTSQAISKWENGRGIPDIEMLKKLSEIFKVDISELSDGKENKKNKKKIIIAFSVIAVLIVVLCTIFFILSKDTFKFSSIATDNDSFSIKGVIASDKYKHSIYISKIDYENKLQNEKEYVVMECVLYESVGNTEHKISQCGDLDKYDHYDKTNASTLSDLLKNVEFNIDDYNCSCKTDACSNLYLKINALNINDSVVTYKIPLQVDKKCNN
ncbi:MAG: helix-turn-helix transcriptional regulator [Bacilli bacterium]